MADPAEYDLGEGARSYALLRRRLLILLIIFSVPVLALIGRLFYLQWISYKHYQLQDRENRIRVEPVVPLRGRIYAADGILLAQNIPVYDLVLLPEWRSPRSRAQQALERARRIPQVQFPSMQVLRQRHERTLPQQPLLLQENLSEAIWSHFHAFRLDYAGLDIRVRSRRFYPLGEIASHVTGYTAAVSPVDLESDDASLYRIIGRIGRSGLERYYEHELRGHMGSREVEVDVDGFIERVLEETPARRGLDVHTSINTHLQIEAHNALQGTQGAVVALEPDSGRVLALVSTPAFDPQAPLLFSGMHQGPMFNRALRGTYNPGSTIKPMIALAGLQYDARSLQEPVVCRGSYRLPGRARQYRDWKPGGHGVVDWSGAIEQSCNIYFYTLGLELGMERMSTFLRHFGLGIPSGIDLAGEVTGILPGDAWKRAHIGEPWYPGDTVVASIGQGYLTVTPMQLAVAVATLATAGQRPVPRLLTGFSDVSDKLQRQPVPASEAVELNDPMDWEYARFAMRDVAHGLRGTARGVFYDLPFRLAGKTGTSQVVRQDPDQDKDAFVPEALRNHALFIGYAPVRQPRIAVTVIVEHGGSGSRSAAPVARRIMEEYLHVDD